MDAAVSKAGRPNTATGRQPVWPPWHWPAAFIAGLRHIDADREPLMPGWRGEFRVAITLMVVAVCLLLLNYLKLSSSFQAFLGWFDADGGRTLLRAWRSSPYQQLYSLAWWGLWHLVCYLLLPWLVIRYVFRERLCQHGLGWGTVHQHWRWYLLLLSPILVFVVLVSFRHDFVNHYPFYRFAYRSWAEFLVWEIIYLSQFVFLEFFFRGFMLRSLRPSIGVNAIFVMCVPYLMIHFPKPWLEATGAILFGLFLGMLALRSRSIWGGVGVHAGVALSMDVAALLQSRGLPKVWWP